MIRSSTSVNLNRLQATVKSNVLNLANAFQRFKEPIVRKCEGTVLERAGIFLKNTAVDYKEVFVETYEKSKTNPLKTTLYMGAMGLCGCCAKKNPDDASFRDQLLCNQQKMMLISETTRNPLPVQKVKEIEDYYNQGKIRIFSLGVLSLMWVDDHDDKTALYEAQCDYLSPTIHSYPSRVIDIGFWGKWWLLFTYMRDYDVNPEEFKNFKN